MANLRVKFTFQPDLIKNPIIWSLGREFEIVTNIRRANVAEDQGWVILELNGEQTEIDKGIDWIINQGVRVDFVEGDIVAG
jgi:ABC-type methionine transport system ATPase subunit|tara:strand:+ start:57 stop:299 length:243 start_codon:yes stop_codon:yes gene_type:complete